MAGDRLSEAALRVCERGGRERASRAPGGAWRRGDDDAIPPSAPPSSHRRIFGWAGGDTGCELCARRAQSGPVVVIGPVQVACQILVASWVVLTVGER